MISANAQVRSRLTLPTVRQAAPMFMFRAGFTVKLNCQENLSYYWLPLPQRQIHQQNCVCQPSAVILHLDQFIASCSRLQRCIDVKLLKIELQPARISAPEQLTTIRQK
ncbi:Hypothetical_protein [Hexamita inflata]|uniref:Hypothetical_protein n=1 Tax=Hexamita inflata TaxID=28002 RepID=A0AA86U6J2_9EUKA|nr:Hypothetical protein HINF_LOCUS30614 [Hexamita inflata]